ncbi:MAG TPA: hypothetical protein DCZ72_08990 [Armatimonadetes bacterium]|nr:hypothetical protein [Armatimonadota bacterium]
MSGQRPNAVVLSSAYQVLLGLIWVSQVGAMPNLMYKLLLLSIAGGHFYAAVGLYLLTEWGRQRAVQFALFDILAVLPKLFSGQLLPWGAVLQLGMPLYILHALNDRKIRERFS